MIISGTGHRPNKLGGYSQEVQDKLIKVLSIEIEKIKPNQIISGMALGYDIALAKVALNYNIPLIAAVPFLEQEKLWPLKSQAEYFYLLSKAKDIIYTADIGYAAWKMQIRNEWMVDHSDLVLALWDGSSGGTGNCIKYANKLSKPIRNLWDDWNKEL